MSGDATRVGPWEKLLMNNEVKHQSETFIAIFSSANITSAAAMHAARRTANSKSGGHHQRLTMDKFCKVHPVIMCCRDIRIVVGLLPCWHKPQRQHIIS